MTIRYAYRGENEPIRHFFLQSVQDLKRPLSDSIGYAVSECNLAERSPIGRVLGFTALAKMALAFDYVGTFDSELGRSDPLSADIREYCTDGLVNAAAAALETEEDRQAFLQDIAEVRAALKIN